MLTADFLQHPRRNQLLLDMPLERLLQETPQIRATHFGPRLAREILDRRAEHLCSNCTRLSRHFRRRQPLIIRAHQSVCECVKKGPMPIQSSATYKTLREFWQEAH